LVPPNQGEQDYQGPPQGLSRISGQENDMYVIIDFLNQHLVFFLAVVAFLAVLYTGYQFITQGPDEAVKAGKNLIT
jgi:fumarate reductase subunit C